MVVPTVNVLVCGDSETFVPVTYVDLAIPSLPSFYLSNRNLIFGTRPADFLHSVIQPYWQNSSTINILTEWSAFDAIESGRTGAQCYAEIAPLTNDWKSNGPSGAGRVAVATTGLWGMTGTLFTECSAFDALVRAGVGIDFDYIWDISAIAQFPQDGSALPAQYGGPGSHLNAAGSALIAPLFAQVISQAVWSVQSDIAISLRFGR